MIPGATGFVDRRSERWQEGPHTASDMITSEAARIALRALASSLVLEARLSFLPRAHNGVKTLGKRHQRTVVGPNKLNLDKLPFSCTCGLIPLEGDAVQTCRAMKVNGLIVRCWQRIRYCRGCRRNARLARLCTAIARPRQECTTECTKFSLLRRGKAIPIQGGNAQANYKTRAHSALFPVRTVRGEIFFRTPLCRTYRSDLGVANRLR